MTIASHPFLTALALGLAYLLVWALYRFRRAREHRAYREIHGRERRYRANFDPHVNLPPEEQLRRAEWDAEYGPLSGPLDLKNREENRWPVGAALQGATTVTMSLLVAALIWTVRTGPQSRSQTPPVTTSSEAAFGSSSQAVPSTLTSRPMPLPPEPASAYPSVPLTLSVAVVMMILGVVTAVAAESKLAKATGATLAVTASLLSGAKLLSVDKILTTKNLFTVHYAPSYGEPTSYRPASASFARRIYLPAFPSGSATPRSQLQCATETLGHALAEDPSVSRITVLGAADRQELSSRARQHYASNWALAQQRGRAIQQLLEHAAVSPVRILVLNSGPLRTDASSQEWEYDRRVSLLIEGNGTPQSWASSISSEGTWSTCAPESEKPMA